MSWWTKITGHDAREKSKREARRIRIEIASSKRRMEADRKKAQQEREARARNMASSRLGVDDEKSAEKRRSKKKKGAREKKALGKKRFKIELNNLSGVGGITNPKSGLGIPTRT